jgi:hypothetical protein
MWKHPAPFEQKFLRRFFQKAPVSLDLHKSRRAGPGIANLTLGSGGAHMRQRNE